MDEASGSIYYVSYVGTAGDDRANGIAVNGSDVYLTGSTTGPLPGATQAGSTDGFVAKLDGSDGSLASAKQFGSGLSYRGSAIIVDPAGTSVLSRLGLPTGDALPDNSDTVIANSAARAGQSFKISVNGGTPQTITLSSTDTFGYLAFRINQVLGQNGAAKFVDSFTNSTLKIAATNNASVQLIAGPSGSDLLSAIGLSPTTLYGTAPGTQLSTDLTPLTSVSTIISNATDPSTKDQSIFELGFVDNLNLNTASDASQVRDIINNALLSLRKAYSFITTGSTSSSTASSNTGTVSAETAKQVAAYQSLVNNGFVTGG